MFSYHNNSYSHSLNGLHTLTKQRKKIQASRLPTDKKRDCPSCLWVANINTWLSTYSTNTKGKN